MNDLSEIFDKHKKSVLDFIDGVRNEAYKKGRKNALEDLKYVFAIAEQLKEQRNE